MPDGTCAFPVVVGTRFGTARYNPSIIDLPPISDERIAVHVTPDAMRHMRSGHPWLWDNSIERTNKPGRRGDLAVIFDENREFAAIGLWDPTAPIAVRILHHGSPTRIDAEFFTDRLIAALERRAMLAESESTTAYRLVHGENDQLPGLVVDRYASTLVVKLDTAAWMPWLSLVVPQLVELTDAERVVLRASRNVQGHFPDGFHEGCTLVGTAPTGPIEFLENGLRFQADVVRGQKTGHFLDQRDNRQLVGSQSSDADVLDVFCNSGGFSVHAARGGARSVHSVDVSQHAIDATELHLEMNRSVFPDNLRTRSTASDAFMVMEQLVNERRRFDLVVVDPPSFAPNNDAIPGAERAYRELTGLAVELLHDGGWLFQASCSSRISSDRFHEVVAEGLERSGRQMMSAVRTTHAVDHPITFAQGSYLKAVMAQIAG